MSVADSLLAYSFAALLLTLTPGLDTALILRTATVEGGKKAFQAALGIDTGCFIWGAAVSQLRKAETERLKRPPVDFVSYQVSCQTPSTNCPIFAPPSDYR